MTVVTAPPTSSLLDISPVVPVVVLPNADVAVPMAKAMLHGGIRIIEVTLRSAAALEGVARIAAEVPGMKVGVGTVLSPRDVDSAVAAGAQFLVSPGTTPELLDAMEASGIPFLPGVATVSEVRNLVERGIGEMKFFPAKAAGGPEYLKSIGGPIPQVRFCPTGGITAITARDYLALPNVGCVGGTWLAPSDAVATGDWTCTTQLATQAAGLRARKTTRTG
jgi:2-dehydro-3-deoxyphosphogluconate aldolase/(4S)-4-hydroxy-2-oxoglutarate aldolase